MQIHQNGGGILNPGIILFLIGFAISGFHWVGIIIAGSGLSFFGKSIKTKVLFGAVAGVAIWLAFVAYTLSTGMYDKIAHTGSIFNVSIFLSILLGGVAGLTTAYQTDYR